MAKKGKAKSGDLISKTGAVVSGAKLNPAQKAYAKKLRAKASAKAASKTAADPGAFTQPLSLKTATQQAKAENTMQYGPQKLALQAQVRGSQDFATQQAGWFDQYKGALENARQQTAAAYGTAQSDVANRSNQLQSQDAAQRAQLAQKEAGQNAIQGAAPNTQNEQVAQQASTARAASSNNFQDLLSSRGAAQSGYLSQRQPIADLQKLQAQQTENKRQQGYQKQLQDLATTRGAALSARVGALRENERKYGLERSAFGLNVQKANQAASSQNAALQLQLQKLGLSKDQAAETARHNQATETISASKGSGSGSSKSSGGSGSSGGGGSKKSGGLTPAQTRSGRTKANNAIALARQIDPGARAGTRRGGLIEQALLAKKVDAKLAHGVAYYLAHGGVTSKLRNDLRKIYGLKLPLQKKSSGKTGSSTGSIGKGILS